MTGLTQTQAAVLAFINEFRREQQCPPTRREIADHFGWRSANAAEDHLQALQRKGAIWLKPGRARCIHVNEAHAAKEAA